MTDARFAAILAVAGTLAGAVIGAVLGAILAYIFRTKEQRRHDKAQLRVRLMGLHQHYPDMFSVLASQGLDASLCCLGMSHAETPGEKAQYAQTGVIVEYKVARLQFQLAQLQRELHELLGKFASLYPRDGDKIRPVLRLAPVPPEIDQKDLDAAGSFARFVQTFGELKEQKMHAFEHTIDREVYASLRELLAVVDSDLSRQVCAHWVSETSRWLANLANELTNIIVTGDRKRPVCGERDVKKRP